VNFDSENFIYKNGLNVERYVFAEIRRVAAMFFLIMSLVLIARGESMYEDAYIEYNYAYNCDAYMREKYKTYSGRNSWTEDEFVAQKFGDDGVCNNSFYIWEGLIGLYLFFLITLLFMIRGVRYRFDKRRRIIYTVLNWKTYIYRVPSNIDDLFFDIKNQTLDTPPYVVMTNIVLVE
jgi:Ni,Fe-hydrogenase I cytochrome b subunit